MIVFEDRHVLVVNKPPGLQVQDSGNGKKNLEDVLRQDRRYVFACHRLDTVTGGLVLLAKSSKALSRLQQAFREGKVKKHYRAWLEGQLQVQKALLEDVLESKKAMLHYRVLAKEATKTLVDIELLTGRYHQIRIQFSSRGFPVLGDRLYGANMSWKGAGIGLLCVGLEFEHPVEKELLSLWCESPHFLPLGSCR